MAKPTPPARLRRLLLRVAGKLESLARQRAEARAEKDVEAKGLMQRIVEERFRRESTRSKGGLKWAPLAPSTVKRRGSAHPILRDSGQMKDMAWGAAAGTYRCDHDKMSWDVEDVGVEYAKWVEHGTPRMPPRHFFLTPNDPELEKADALAAKAIMAELNRLARGPA